MAARMKVAIAASPPNDILKRRSEAAFERDLVALLPHLRNFSRSLCGRREFAEDLAQETLIKAWRSRDRFQPGTNLRAWLFTILRHEFYSYQRRAWRHAPWDEDFTDSLPAPADEQSWAMDLSDCTRALGQLPVAQRETVLLVGVGGFSYRDAADLLGAPIGTLKSRLARGRDFLAKSLTGDRPLANRLTTRAADGVNDILAQMSAVEAAARCAAL
jgi:RNA polymerase sigma-70 factor (ECF subfamily)